MLHEECVGITIGITMGAAKFAISVDESLLKKLDRLVKKGLFPSRSRAFQSAMKEKIDRLERTRLARECAKLDKKSEQRLAEDISQAEFDSWPEY
jgi:metal-responsive CopG/Arc/MetJ family transcriptional regulator